MNEGITANIDFVADGFYQLTMQVLDLFRHGNRRFRAAKPKPPCFRTKESIAHGDKKPGEKSHSVVTGRRWQSNPLINKSASKQRKFHLAAFSMGYRSKNENQNHRQLVTRDVPIELQRLQRRIQRTRR